MVPISRHGFGMGRFDSLRMSRDSARSEQDVRSMPQKHITGRIYGIDAKGKLWSLWVEREGGSTWIWHSDGLGYSHLVHPSNKDKPLREAHIVFQLTDAFEVPVAFMDSEQTKKKVAELKAKADAIRATKSGSGEDN